MEIALITIDLLKISNTYLLVDTIYDNFKNLGDIKKLNHNKKEIERILKSNNSFVLFIMKDKKIISYLIAEKKLLSDGREVLYIYYLFTSLKFRNMGLASTMLDTAKQFSNKNNCTGIMLTCDTDNIKVHDFYLKKGFMPDMLMRTYNKYDVLYL
jgi:RimJ/RimL family protein N-acetyltransferase